MHKVTFYPIGNADSILITLANGKYVLFDYADKADKEDEDDKRIDLASELEQTVDNDFDVVAFTHADDDHIHGFSDFFYLEHAKKYQSEDRKKITTLWVPAAIVLEENLEDEAKILRSEARHRLKNGEGIRVFSKPEALKDWLESEGLSVEERSDCITSAGELAPEFNFANDDIEFFVHSPFVVSVDDKSYDRNDGKRPVNHVQRVAPVPWNRHSKAVNHLLVFDLVNRLAFLRKPFEDTSKALIR